MVEGIKADVLMWEVRLAGGGESSLTTAPSLQPTPFLALCTKVMSADVEVYHVPADGSGVAY